MNAAAEPVRRDVRHDAAAFHPPAVAIDRLQSTALMVGLAGLVLCGIGAVLSLDYFFRSWLVGWAYFVGIRGGSLGEGAAISLFLLPVLVIVAILMLRFARKVEVT